MIRQPFGALAAAALAAGAASGFGGMVGHGFTTSDRHYDPPNVDRMSNRQKRDFEKALRRRARMRGDAA